ncbi:hypothetical protein [Dankookia sp. P2]|uniref:hypothetical protein n=1 Tax=Dankookia sp. P2 TaxID=3423955 RepID=UPI003D66E725
MLRPGSIAYATGSWPAAPRRHRAGAAGALGALVWAVTLHLLMPHPMPAATLDLALLLTPRCSAP